MLLSAAAAATCICGSSKKMLLLLPSCNFSFSSSSPSPSMCNLVIHIGFPISLNHHHLLLSYPHPPPPPRLPAHQHAFRSPASLKTAWFGDPSPLSKAIAMLGSSRTSPRSPRTTAGLEEISHNQVLLAALTACILGQMLKPFTSALQGKGFNWKLAVKSGGMPSTHSALATATCTALALERGLADSLFGLSVVFACIVMYDAQGVRRAVGKQAEVINTLVFRSMPASTNRRLRQVRGSGQYSSGTDSEFMNHALDAELESGDSESSSARLRTAAATTTPNMEKGFVPFFVTDRQSGISKWNSTTLGASAEENGAFIISEDFINRAKELPSVKIGEVNMQKLGDLEGWQHVPLKESVGHTKIEVLAGGLWGIVTTVIVSHFY